MADRNLTALPAVSGEPLPGSGSRKRSPATVPGLLRDHPDPSHTALIIAGASLTIGEWRARAFDLASRLDIRRGDRVALTSKDWISYAVQFVAVTAAGGVAVPMSLPQIPPGLLLFEDVVSGHRRELPEVAETDLAQIIYTSGTTGDAKGVSATHANLTYGIAKMAHSQHALHAFPIGTNAAQTMLLAAMHARPTIVAMPQFDPVEFAKTAEQYRTGSVFVVPAMAIAMLNADVFAQHDLSEVVLFASSAAPLPPAVSRALADAMPDAAIVNNYTSTEAAPAHTTMVFDLSRPDSVGRPFGEIRIGEDNEVWLRSPTTPRAYYDDPQATAATFQDGWVRMGDLGYLDDDGYLYLLDRESDVVKSGAHKVSTLRVEAAIHEHPGVCDAAAIGIPHPVMGMTVAAAVVSDSQMPDLRAFLSTRLAPHEIPTRFLFLTELPRNEAGKVRKGRLRELLTASAKSARPTAESEVEMAAYWQSLLGARDVGVGDDFFALGGDSMTATRLAARYGIPVSVVFDNPVLSALITRLDKPSNPEGGLIPRAEAPQTRNEGLPLTSTQESMLDWMYAGEDTRDVGPISVGFRIRDVFDPDRFGRALGLLTRRHEALRTVFHGRTPSILDDCLPSVTVVSATTEEEAADLLRADRELKFDLTSGPLVRAIVVSLGEHDHVVGLAVHHLVFDGASMGVLLHELGLAYSGSPLPKPASVREFAERTRARWPVTRPHWSATLEEAPKYLEPFPERLHAVRTRSESLEFTLPPIRDVATAHGVTPFMVIAAAWIGALSAWTGESDIVLMTPVTGRTRPGDESLIGCLVQSLLIRSTSDLADVRRACLAALDHQHYPFAEFYQRHIGAGWLRVESWAGPAHFPGLESESFELPRALDADWPTPGGEPDRSVPELAVVEQPDGLLKAWLLWNHYAFDRSTLDKLQHLLLDQIGRYT